MAYIYICATKVPDTPRSSHDSGLNQSSVLSCAGVKPHIGPILVVCLTNHALDSFLEDLLDSGATTSLVRVGGRSKNPRLEEYNLRNSGMKVRGG